MRQCSWWRHVEQIGGIVDEHLGDDMVAKQIDDLLVVGCQNLGESGCQGEATKVLQQAVVGGSHAKGQAIHVVDVLARVLIVQTFRSCHGLAGG